MNWHIKKFDELTNVELYKLLGARSEVFIVEQTCPYQDIDGKDFSAFHLYAESNGEIAAYVRILPQGISYNEASIGRVLVSQNFRKQALGKAVMQKAIEYMKVEMQEKNIRISAQEYLLKFYQDLGFKQVSAMYLEDDIPHIEMLWSYE
ncbi:GNAT family N-acetyltransferase [Limibacter armeniacum]|uniref:GNAT family N-acetyltransferase n=1 Tax=Limibacter armeniacum TaxID=466084 RepID=UPI002FE51B9A